MKNVNKMKEQSHLNLHTLQPDAHTLNRHSQEGQSSMWKTACSVMWFGWQIYLLMLVLGYERGVQSGCTSERVDIGWEWVNLCFFVLQDVDACLK